MSTTHPTKQRLLESGIQMLLEQGYNDLGIESLLKATGIPRGSFYHHFEDKEDFALAAVDAYMTQVHATLDACLGDESLAPVDRIRKFFETTTKAYAEQGHMGCLLGGLGQELSGVSEVFRRKVVQCFEAIGQRLTGCLELAKREGQLAHGADPQRLGRLLVDCWEGAALRSRLQSDAAPLKAMLDFYFSSAAVRPRNKTRAAKSRRKR